MKEKQLDFREIRPDATERLQSIQENRHPIALLLDSIGDPRNLGLLFRLADAARLEAIYLWNCPEEEPGKKTERISRQTVPLVQYQHIKREEDLEKLSQTYQPICLEWTDQSIPYTNLQPKEKTLLIIGNEQAGVSQKLLDLSQGSIYIPMYGMNTSMNVACASSIAVYDLIGKSLS